MSDKRWQVIRDRSLFAGFIVVTLNVFSVLIGWFAGNPPPIAATRSLALTSQFVASPWLRRILGAGGYEATTTAAITGILSTLMLVTALAILALILVYRIESPQVLLIPSAALSLSAGIVLVLRMTQPGPGSLAGMILLFTVCLLGLRTVLAVLVWMNEQHIDGAVGTKRVLRRFRSSYARGTGYYSRVEKLEDTQIGIAFAVGIIALVIGPFVGERLWGEAAQAIIPTVGPSLAKEFRLGSIFASGFTFTYWIGGMMVVAAWGALALLGPPWRNRNIITVPSLVVLLICSFFLLGGAFDRQTSRAANTILADNGLASPTKKQLSKGCVWFSIGDEPPITLVVTKPTCKQVVIYSGRKVEGRTSLPGTAHPTIGATYPEGPVLAQLEKPDGLDTLSGLVGLNWFGGIKWTYECPNGDPLRVHEFVGSGAGSSSIPSSSSRVNRERDDPYYVVVKCGDLESTHYINAKDGQEI